MAVSDERAFRLRVRWLGRSPVEQAAGTEFGMQRGRWELVAGTSVGDTLVFETEVAPYRDKAGRTRYRGPDVQGPPDEPFLYLSWRIKSEQAWLMRAKVLLSPLTEEFLQDVPEGTVLETTVTRLGGRDRGHVQEWRAV